MGETGRLYWLCQLGGWGLFVLGNIVIAFFDGQAERSLVWVSLLTVVSGIGLTHVLRWHIHRSDWRHLGQGRLIPRMVLSAVLLGIFFVAINSILTEAVAGRMPFAGRNALRHYLLNALNFSVVFLIWEIIYFAVKTFQNWKEEEIANLELRAAKTEIELNSFKAQLNPHFLFNSLNSIRALVDEEPERAKRAITQLSGILRNNLMLGKRQTVSLGEELDLVEKYLSIEKIRFEERLQVRLEVDPGTLGYEIPPFMLQTLVENGIKHGISRRTEGGKIEVFCRRVPGGMQIRIESSGAYRPDPSHEGIGIANTRKRLDLIFGGRARFSIRGEGDSVLAELYIPQTEAS